MSWMFREFVPAVIADTQSARTSELDVLIGMRREDVSMFLQEQVPEDHLRLALSENQVQADRRG